MKYEENNLTHRSPIEDSLMNAIRSFRMGKQGCCSSHFRFVE